MIKTKTVTSTVSGEYARFRTDDSGATAIEYAIIASGVGVAVAATVFALGSKVNTLFANIAALFT